MDATTIEHAKAVSNPCRRIVFFCVTSESAHVPQHPPITISGMAKRDSCTGVYQTVEVRSSVPTCAAGRCPCCAAASARSSDRRKVRRHPKSQQSKRVFSQILFDHTHNGQNTRKNSDNIRNHAASLATPAVERRSSILLDTADYIEHTRRWNWWRSIFHCATLRSAWLVTTPLNAGKGSTH